MKQPSITLPCECGQSVLVLYVTLRGLLCLACLTWEEVERYPVTAAEWRLKGQGKNKCSP